MKLLLAVALLASGLALAGEDFTPEDLNWVVPKHRVSLESDAVNAFCFGYIKRLRGLWYDIHQKGVEVTMEEHPPEAEGVDPEKALSLAREIEVVSPEGAQAWIERKWAGCMKDPRSVGQ
jgi:hypothetical protein